MPLHALEATQALGSPMIYQQVQYNITGKFPLFTILFLMCTHVSSASSQSDAVTPREEKRQNRPHKTPKPFKNSHSKNRIIPSFTLLAFLNLT